VKKTLPSFRSSAKISILGAGGKVARATLQHLFFHNTAPLDLNLVSQTPRKIEGALLDIHHALALSGPSLNQERAVPRTVLSCEPTRLDGSDLILILAGRWPSAEEQKNFYGRDDTGRLAQSLVNHRLIVDLTRRIESQAPEATVVVVTNQSDMMARVSRETLNPAKVFGFGGMVDSARFCHHLSQGREPDKKVQAHLVGYHNNDMILLSQSLRFEGAPPSETNLAAALARTRGAGAEIPRLQQDEAHPDLIATATVAPGVALAACVLAFTGQIPPFEASFNAVLDSQESAARYGLESGQALSVPVSWNPFSLQVAGKHTATEGEKTHLRRAHATLEEEVLRLKGFLAQGR